MKFIKMILQFVVIIIIIALFCGYYAFNIEPYLLTTNTIEICVSNPLASEINIVQFSDTHIKEEFTHENFAKVVDEINALEADIVIFSGDLYDNYSVYKDDSNIINELSRIEAQYGKFAIWGNRDYGGGAVQDYETIMTSSGFSVLSNDSEIVNIDDDKILITAIDDSLLGNPIQPYIDKSIDADFSIFLSHEPDVIEQYSLENYDLVLSGHTHGGQVNIPFLPFINEYALNLSEFSSIYDGGINILDDSPEQLLYVNTGIGTTKISARFGVVPEIANFVLCQEK